MKAKHRGEVTLQSAHPHNNDLMLMHHRDAEVCCSVELHALLFRIVKYVAVLASAY